MLIEDLFIPLKPIATEKWQLGSLMTNKLHSGGVALLFVSDYRGSGLGIENSDYGHFREIFYRLSRQDFSLPITDLGELRPGKTFADTLYIVEDLVMTCLHNGVFPIVLGGSEALSYSLVSAINAIKNNIHYTQISAFVSFKDEGNEISAGNYLSKTFKNHQLSLKEFNLIGYQKHLNDAKTLEILMELDGHVLRLGEVMGATHRAEPLFRHADVVTLNCDAVESLGGNFSIHSQVNGLNNREICSCMRDIGTGNDLKSLGIFNFNFSSKTRLNHQLLAQMLWYFLEGFHIQRTHPKERHYETFMVMLDDSELIFHRDTFSNQWYFGNNVDMKKWIPCTQEDYHNAKQGKLNKRLK